MVNELLKKLARLNDLKSVTMLKSEIEGTNNIEIETFENKDGSITINFREEKWLL